MKKNHHRTILNWCFLFVVLFISTSSKMVADELRYEMKASTYAVDLNAINQPIHFSHRMSDSNIKVSATAENILEVRLAKINHWDKVDGRAVLKINQQTGEVSLQTTGDLKDSNLHMILPISASLSVQSSDGDIKIDGIDGDVQCSSSDGNIRLTHLTGRISAESSDGNILLSMRDTTGTNPVSLSTQDGNIDLRLSANTDATILTSVIDGNISYHLSGIIRINSPKALGKTGKKPWERIFSANQTQIHIGKGQTKQPFQLSALDGNIRISNH